jgi:tetratricopeptide (TPR) repeat protein
MMVTLPLVLLLLDYWPLGRMIGFGTTAVPPPETRTPWIRLLIEKVPFLALSAVACLLTVQAQQRTHSVVSLAGLPLSRRVPHAVVAYAHYLGAMVLPRQLAAHYPYPDSTPVIAFAAAAVALASASVFALWFARRRPYVLVGWLWFLGTLVPVIGLVQVGDQAWADRYTYLPLVGIFLALVWGLADLAREIWPGPDQSRAIRLGLVGAAVGLGLALLLATSLQLRYWKDTRSLFSRAAAVTHNNARALTVLGSLLARDGKLPEAIALYTEALRYQPDNPEAHFFFGNALELQGKLDEAIAEYTRALGFKPLQEKTHLALGVVLAKQQRYNDAAAHDRAVLALNPESALAHNNLARVLHTQGRLGDAAQHYSAALKLDPSLAQAHNNLGVVLLQQGRVSEGAAHLQAAARLNPADPETQFNLALALNQQALWDQAAALFSRLAPGRPNDPNLNYQFGLALSHLQRTREAMSRLAHALVLQPDFPEALSRLAWILCTAPQAEYRNGEEALPMAERACELTGRKEPRFLATLAAAYAEAGRFPEAVSFAQQARDLAAGQKLAVAQYSAWLETLQSGIPIRDAH